MTSEPRRRIIPLLLLPTGRILWQQEYDIISPHAVVEAFSVGARSKLGGAVEPRGTCGLGSKAVNEHYYTTCAKVNFLFRKTQEYLLWSLTQTMVVIVHKRSVAAVALPRMRASLNHPTAVTTTSPCHRLLRPSVSTGHAF